MFGSNKSVGELPSYCRRSDGFPAKEKKRALPGPGDYRLKGGKARRTCEFTVGGLPLDEADELLRRCQRGDESALAEIVRLYQERIFRLAYRVTGDAALAEDATAEALAKIWMRARQWRGDARAGTWIYQVALRTVLDQRRAWQRRLRLWLSLPAELTDSQAGPAEKTIDAERRRFAARRIQEAFAQLSDKDRALAHLYYFEQRSLAEIATILDTTRDALKMRLARARRRLRELLRDCDGLY